MVITTVEVLDEQGSQALQKPVGKYVTVEMPSFRENGQAFYEVGSKEVRRQLKEMLPDGGTVLVAGLGNRAITPDALGPRVTDLLIVTRHLFALAPEATEGLGAICAIAPGVLGVTGMETSEIVKGVVEHIRPDAVIAVDALASRRMDRISTTVQIADTGIHPGSGIGNDRQGLTQETLGVPVIAVGVPLVVDAAAVAFDAMTMVDGTQTEETFRDLQQAIGKNIGALMVTPKDIDKLLTQMVRLVSAGINTAVHSIGLEEIDSYIG